MTGTFATKVELKIFRRPLAISMKEASYNLILFDLFHTLVDVGSAPKASGRYTADILGISREVWNSACFSSAHDICRPTRQLDVIRALAHSIEPSIPESLIKEAAVERQQRFDHALLQVDQEVLDCLKALRRMGLRLALLSNASTDEVSAWTESPLATLFEHAFFSWECGCAKPQPRFYRHALESMSVSAGQTLFVGDGGSDEHVGARRVGIDNVLLTRHIGHYDEARLAPRRAAVKWEIGSLAELVPLLERIG